MRKIDNRAQCNTNKAIPPAVNRIIGKPKDLAIRHIRPDELTDIVSWFTTMLTTT